ncbi:MAG: class I SAM-dependent methyltransferase [Clostridiales bacterium]|nr:class I SAM-dependent methyltransferase [Clostridiales bacterium]
MQRFSKRLSAVAGLVKQDSVIADVGTDHGYIPVSLYKSGKIKGAFALDINEAPLSSCKALVEQEGLSFAIETRLSDGLDNLCPDLYDTIIIAGMGGELIADILSRCEKLSEKHIILNPMTHPEIVRKFLYDNGFDIENDFIVKDARHCYSVFDAHYKGFVGKKTRLDYYLGNIKNFENKEYFSHLLNFVKNKSKSGDDYSDIITALEDILNDNS